MSDVEKSADLLVDIVINNHNYAAFLADAVESARSQTHGRVNVVVVDDGSTDESRAILERQGEGLTVVLKENGGQASALNAGLERCAGDIVIFLDADDVLRPDAAALAAGAFAAAEYASKVQYRMEVIDSDGRPTGETKPAPHLPMPNGDVRRAELAYPFDLVWLATSGNAFRRAALRRILPIPEDSYPGTGADWYLVHLSALLGDVVSLDSIGAAYRVHGDNDYERQDASVDLPHLRQAIGFAEATSAHLLRLADSLALPRPARILSVADLANRIVSLKLEPDLHPIREDRRGGLLRDAIGALRRRDNASPAMKALFLSWFTAMAVAPRPLARRLAELFLFPQRRPSLNGLLGRMHGSATARATAVR
jgi:glycosyltransferase involved in cell wall biosynthesis